MSGMIKPVIASFQFTDFIMNLVAADVSNEDAIKRARDNQGASISWIVQHLCNYRYQAMNLFGADKESEFKEFSTDSATDGRDYPSISELLAKWNQLSGQVQGALEGVSDEQLNSRIKDGNSPHNEKTIMETLTFFTWHESYHMGSLGMIRTELGYPATSEMAIAAASANKS